MSETEIAADGYAFDLTGGHLALDFANTMSRREDPAESREYLTSYGRLVTWGVQTGLLSPADAERLRADATDRPRAAVAALRRAAAVREAIYAVLMPAAHGERVAPDAIEALNTLLPEALGALRLEPQRDGFRWRFS